MEKIIKLGPLENTLITFFNDHPDIVSQAMGMNRKEMKEFLEGISKVLPGVKLELSNKIDRKLKRAIMKNDIRQTEERLNQGSIRKSKVYEKYVEANGKKIALELLAMNPEERKAELIRLKKGIKDGKGTNNNP